jgi:hypothetical protein
MYVGDALVPSYFNRQTTSKKHSLIHHKNVDYILARKTPLISKKVTRLADNTPPQIRNTESKEELLMTESVRNSYLLNYDQSASSMPFRRKRTSSARAGYINLP